MALQFNTHRARNLDVLSIVDDKLRCSLAPLTFSLQDDNIVVGALNSPRNTIKWSQHTCHHINQTVEVWCAYCQIASHIHAGMQSCRRGTDDRHRRRGNMRCAGW